MGSSREPGEGDLCGRLPGGGVLLGAVATTPRGLTLGATGREASAPWTSWICREAELLPGQNRKDVFHAQRPGTEQIEGKVCWGSGLTQARHPACTALCGRRGSRSREAEAWPMLRIPPGESGPMSSERLRGSHFPQLG